MEIKIEVAVVAGYLGARSKAKSRATAKPAWRLEAGSDDAGAPVVTKLEKQTPHWTFLALSWGNQRLSTRRLLRPTSLRSTIATATATPPDTLTSHHDAEPHCRCYCAHCTHAISRPDNRTSGKGVKQSNQATTLLAPETRSCVRPNHNPRPHFRPLVAPTRAEWNCALHLHLA